MSRMLVISLIGFGMLCIAYAIAQLAVKFMKKPEPKPPAEPVDHIAARRAELEARRRAIEESRELSDINRELERLDGEAESLRRGHPVDDTTTQPTSP